MKLPSWLQRLLPASKHDLKQLENKIMATEQQVLDALGKIDTATSKIATNLQTESTVLQTVSDEIDALKTALSNAGVSQNLIDTATALQAKVQASSDALDAQVPVLQAIAAKGVLNPVPVPPPAPTPVVPTPPGSPVPPGATP